MSHSWIRPTSLIVSLFWLATTPACGTSAASESKPLQAPVAAAQVAAEPPPHVFTPRSHPARVHSLPPSPQLASLPPLVDRSATCFGWHVEEERQVMPTSTNTRRTKKGKKKKKRAPGHVPYSGGGSGAKKKDSKGRRRKEARARGSGGVPGGVPGGVAGGVVGGVLGGTVGGKASGSGASSKPRPKPQPKPESKPRPQPEPEPAPAMPSASAPVDANRDTRAYEYNDTDESAPAIASDPHHGYEDWGSAIYLSNDDTMSLSSAQRVIYAIDHFLPLPSEHIRPHELLNYFSFHTEPVADTDDFSVHASIAPDLHDEGIYSLAMAVRGRPLGIEQRRNANLSLVIDRSGSMSAEGRMEYLKRGLKQLTGQLKKGDMIHLALFDHSVCVPVKNFVVGRDPQSVLDKAIDSLQPRGSTNLHSGLQEGYQIADQAYQPEYTNRVVMITDAIANTGVTDERLLSTVSRYYDKRQIRLSGVGVGRDFNDSLLDKLTEEGKGAYVFLGSEAEVDAVFGARFTSLIETTALDVHFQLHLPPSLRMNTFYGEESSTIKEDVQAIHYFANTSQLFLSDLMAKNAALRAQDSVMLTIEYEDPESGDEKIEEVAFNLGEISQDVRNVRKGRLIMHFVDGLAWMAARPRPTRWNNHAGSWDDADAVEACDAGRAELNTLAEGIGDDPEVQRVQGLWESYCSRFSRPRRPVKRAPPEDTWPSASGQ
ncbi:MAG: VWA domain-containing protein [Myxococcota bacterium]